MLLEALLIVKSASSFQLTLASLKLVRKFCWPALNVPSELSKLINWLEPLDELDEELVDELLDELDVDELLELLEELPAEAAIRT